MLDHDSALALLRAHGQEHVLAFWDRLDEAARAALLAQVEALDFGALETTRALLAARTAGATPAEMEKLALADAKVQAALAGATPRKVICVPKRLVNVVV